MDKENSMPVVMPFGSGEEYFQEPVLFKDCENYYELIYTGDFETIGKESATITKVMQDLKGGDKEKIIVIYINSDGGDVENLSMILQQVMKYEHRITICCGAALSAGFILWACGHERYVSPYSELMYHTISSGYEGKGVELTAYGKHIERLTEKLMEEVGMDQIIPKEDIQIGKSTEVWYLGDDFIKSGKALDYSEFEKRKDPIMIGVLVAGSRFFLKSGVDYYEMEANFNKKYSYCDLLSINNEDGVDLTKELNIGNVIECESSSSSEKKEVKRKKKKARK